MRQSKAIVAAGTLHSNAFGVRHAVLGVAACVAVAWAGVAFAQEAYIGHKLSQQVADLRRQNIELSAQNQGYRRDVQAISSGAANEEEARLNGYTRPNERLYLVAPIPTPSPTPKPSPATSPKSH
jgi:cell division protein FtsB